MMKKLLSILFVGASLTVFAQPNLGITLTSPANNSTINSGTAFNFDVTVNNTGNLAVSTADTILFAPLLNGSFIGTSTGGNLIYFSTAGLATGSSLNLTRSINLSGGADGAINFCAVVAAIGPNWNNAVDSDTTDDQSCVNVTYSSGNVSLGEFTLVDINNISDKSFFDGKVFHVDVRSAQELNSPTLNIYSLTGQKVFQKNLNNSNGGLVDEINVQSLNLNSGLYVTEIVTVDGVFHNSHKILVN